MLKKAILFILLLILIHFGSVTFVNAAGPTISFTPPTLTTADNKGVTIKATGLATGSKYIFRLPGRGAGGQTVSIAEGGIISFSPEPDGTISRLLCKPEGSYVFQSSCDKNFPEGTYTVQLEEDGTHAIIAVSSSPLTVKAKLLADIKCKNTTTTLTSNDEVILTTTVLPYGSYKVLVGGNDSHKGGACVDTKTDPKGWILEYNVGTYSEGGPYNVEIFKNSSWLSGVGGCTQGDLVAQGSFTISNQPGISGSCTSLPANTITEQKLVVKQCGDIDSNGFKIICGEAGGDTCSTDELHPGFKTAIGCIHTNPTEFVKDFMTFLIAVAGGLTFLMMLLGAFEMLTSAGNPESLNNGRSRLTSAVIGLLFIIFAVLLMQIIGIGFLKLPGFI